MLRDLFPLLLALAAAVLVYALRERRRRRTQVRPPAPYLTMEQAWRTWRAAPHPDALFLPAGLDAPPECAAALAQIERQSLEAAHPGLAVRQAILDNAAMALHLQAIARLPEEERGGLLEGYTPGMDAVLARALAVTTSQWAVLRHYARLKYDDAVPDDWFQQFLRVAAPYVAERVRLARECLVQFDEGAARFVQVYDGLLADLRSDLLKTAPKKRFPPSDLPPPGR